MESITLKTLNNELLDKNGLLKVLQYEAKKRIAVRDALQEDIDDLQSQLNTQVDARTSAVTSLQSDITELQADLQEHVPYPATQSQDSETTVVDRGLDGQALVSTGSGTTTWRDLPETFVSATTVTPDASYSGANGIALATVAVTAGDGGTQQTTSSEIRMPVAVKNPNKLTVRMPTEETDEETGDTVEGTEDVEYDGSAAVSLDIAGLFENVLTLTNANTVDIETFGQEMDERVGGLEDRMDSAELNISNANTTLGSHNSRIGTLEAGATVGRSITEQQDGSVSDTVSVTLGSQTKTNAYTIRETLWSNPAPTTAAPAGTSSTATFVVNLSSSVNNYLFWMIESAADATNAAAPTASNGPMFGTGNLNGRLCIGSGATNNVYRNFTISQDGRTITFNNGNNGSTVNGKFMLPIKIYGFFPIVTN